MYRPRPFVLISHASQQVMKAWIMAGYFPRATGPCADCGATDKKYCWDHRDYCDPMAVEAVCIGCNFKRGKGRVWAYDPETLERVEFQQ